MSESERNVVAAGRRVIVHFEKYLASGLSFDRPWQDLYEAVRDLEMCLRELADGEETLDLDDLAKGG